MHVLQFVANWGQSWAQPKSKNLFLGCQISTISFGEQSDGYDVNATATKFSASCKKRTKFTTFTFVFQRFQNLLCSGECRSTPQCSDFEGEKMGVTAFVRKSAQKWWHIINWRFFYRKWCEKTTKGGKGFICGKTFAISTGLSSLVLSSRDGFLTIQTRKNYCGFCILTAEQTISQVPAQISCCLVIVGTISKYLNEACVAKCEKMRSEIFLMQRRGAIEHIAWKKNKAWPPFSVLYVTSNKKRETKTLINVLHIINSCRRRDLEKKKKTISQTLTAPLFSKSNLLMPG